MRTVLQHHLVQWLALACGAALLLLAAAWAWLRA